MIRPHSVRRERVAGTVAAVLTVVCFVAVQYHTWRIGIDEAQRGDLGGILLAGAFAVTITTLTAGSLVYRVCRFGFLARVPRTEPQGLSGVHEVGVPPDAPSVLILVPSYKEEPRVIRQALPSAMLQDQPRRQLVLLVDVHPVRHPRRAPRSCAMCARSRKSCSNASTRPVGGRHRSATRCSTAWRPARRPIAVGRVSPTSSTKPRGGASSWGATSRVPCRATRSRGGQ